MRLRSAAILSTLAVTASLLVSAPRAGAAVVFADGFESGNLNAWSQKSGLQVVSSTVHGGAFAASSTGSVAWASRTLGSSTLGADATVWFRVENRQDAVTLMRLRTATSTNLVRVFLNGAGRLAYRNERAGVTRASTLVVRRARGIASTFT